MFLTNLDIFLIPRLFIFISHTGVPKILLVRPWTWYFCLYIMQQPVYGRQYI